MSDVLEENEGIALASAEGETTISELDPNPSVEDTDLLATEKSDGSNAKTTVAQLKEVTDSQIETALSGYYNKNSIDELLTNKDLTDANSCVPELHHSKTYELSSTASNVPSNSYEWVIHATTNNRNGRERITQIAESHSVAGLYLRVGIKEDNGVVTWQSWNKVTSEKYNSYEYINSNGSKVVSFSDNAINKKCAYMVTVTGDYSVGKYAGILFIGNSETSIVQLSATNMTVTTTTSALTIKNTGNSQNFSIQITEM